MSNLLKSKFVLGFMVTAFAMTGLMMNANTAKAATCDLGTTTMRVGSHGTNVSCLQTILSITADGSFGQGTKAAVMTFQAANNLTADGVVGAMSRAALSGTAAPVVTGATCPNGMLLSNNCMAPAASNEALCPNGMTLASNCATAPAGTVTTLTGTAGELADVNTLSQYNNEEVGAAMNDVKVLGFEAKASREGDISLKSTKISFALANASGSTKLADYVDSVSVWQGSTKIGSANATDFNKDSTGAYSKTISLSNSVVRADKTEKFYVTVSALSNLDSGDIDSEVVSVGVDNVRYADGSGVVTTDVDTGDLAISGVGIKFVDFSTAANTELKISTNSTPLASVVKASTTSNTDNVVLLKGKMKLDGTSKVWLDEMPITIVTVGGASLDALTGSLTLTLGDNTYSESTGTNCTPSCAGATTAVVTFNNLNYDITAGSTVNFSVSADMNSIDGGDFSQGDTLKASLTTTNRGDIVAENSAGDQLADTTEMTGSAIGEAQGFRSTGVTLALVGTPTASVSLGDPAAPASDSATFTMTFDVTAFGADAWIDSSNPTALGGATESDLDVTGTGTLVATITNVSGGSATPETAGTDAFVVREGTSQRFTITAHELATASGYFNVALTDLLYAATDVDGDTQFTTGLSSFKTGNVYLNNY